ncbi:MAG TPA: hypothetical protein VEA35_00650 [Ramlibacter sp.]|nr:hypothetical protein [Ramlibacter sp.]
MTALTATDVARLLRVHPATLAGHLPALYRQGFPRPREIGRCRRWSADAVVAWLAGKPQAGPKSETESLLEDIRRAF